MNLTRQTNALSVFEKWALQYRKKGQVQIDMDEVLYNNAFYDKSTVSAVSLMNPDAECTQQYLYEKEGQKFLKWTKLRESQIRY